jgi:hypothetical protein
LRGAGRIGYGQRIRRNTHAGIIQRECSPTGS